MELSNRLLCGGGWTATKKTTCDCWTAKKNQHVMAGQPEKNQHVMAGQPKKNRRPKKSKAGGWTAKKDPKTHVIT